MGSSCNAPIAPLTDHAEEGRCATHQRETSRRDVVVVLDDVTSTLRAAITTKTPPASAKSSATRMGIRLCFRAARLTHLRLLCGATAPHVEMRIIVDDLGTLGFDLEGAPYLAVSQCGTSFPLAWKRHSLRGGRNS